jgi:hypothetical protein
MRLMARSNAIAHTLTTAMKASHAWSREGRLPFGHRKALARLFLYWINRHVALAATTERHQETSGGWWLAHYHDELH